jgi:hypothetical protein
VVVEEQVLRMLPWGINKNTSHAQKYIMQNIHNGNVEMLSYLIEIFFGEGRRRWEMLLNTLSVSVMWNFFLPPCVVMGGDYIGESIINNAYIC